MTLRQLEMLRAVAAHGSLSEAAAELELTQPAVSLQMKSLATELGRPLFRGRGRRLELTPAGEILAEYAERVLRLVSDALAAARRGRRDAAVVRVAASSTPGVSLLPRLIADYRERDPATLVRLEVLNSADVERKVQSGEADFGVVGGRRTVADLAAEQWRDDELVLILSSHHALAGRRRIRPREIDGETLLVREAGSATRAAMESAFAQSRVAMPAVHVLGDTEAIKACVAEGLGVGIVSSESITHELRSGLLWAAKLDGVKLSRPLLIVRDATQTPGEAAARFLRFVRMSRG